MRAVTSWSDAAGSSVCLQSITTLIDLLFNVKSVFTTEACFSLQSFWCYYKHLTSRVHALKQKYINTIQYNKIACVVIYGSIFLSSITVVQKSNLSTSKLHQAIINKDYSHNFMNMKYRAEFGLTVSFNAGHHAEVHISISCK